jgi:hypothetical protein
VQHLGKWVVNGDTFPINYLPKVNSVNDPPIVCVSNSIDAGAQYLSFGKTKIHAIAGFFDIGTPYGLDCFRQYFKTHRLKDTL